MKNKVDFTSILFVLNTDRPTGHSFIAKTTLEEFLREYCVADPARELWIDEDHDVIIEEAVEADEWGDAVEAKDAVIGTRYHVRMNRHSQLWPNKIQDTFATLEEAEEHILKGLYWDWCNGKVSDTPYHADTREELVALLREQGVSFTTEHRIAQIKRATSNRKERLQQERAQRLATFAGDDAAVIREWWASEAYHPAPKAVMDIKAKLGLNWKQVRAIGKSV